MDINTDNALSQHQGIQDKLKNKIYYINECSIAERANAVDAHRFSIRKDESDYIIDSIVNEGLLLSSPETALVTSVCVNNNSEVETVGNVVNIHTINQGTNSSFDYTFKRYYSTSDKMTGCMYESSIQLSLEDMFDVVQNGETVEIVSKNAEYVDIQVSELSIVWYINNLAVDVIEGQSSVEFTPYALRNYTVDDEAIIYVELDGVRFTIPDTYSIDRNDYRISELTQYNYINELNVRKKIDFRFNFADITNVALFLDGSQIVNDIVYDVMSVGKEITAVMYKIDDGIPVAPFEVQSNGVVYIKTILYDEETVTDDYLKGGYFDLSDTNGSISGLNKSAPLPIRLVTEQFQIKNFEQSKIKFFSETEQFKFDNDVASDGNGGVLVRNESGVIELYLMEDLIDTELVYKDQDEKYVFTSRSSYENNTNWTIQNIDDMTFEIDSGRIYGNSVNMTYDADINEIKQATFTVLWLESIPNARISIVGIDSDGTETLYMLDKNLTASSSSIFNSRGTKIVNFDMYRYWEFIEFKEGTKKLRIETNSPNMMFESLSIILRRA